ncbi:MAG: hypothetical protein ACPL7E_00280 [bacterium]
MGLWPKFILVVWMLMGVSCLDFPASLVEEKLTASTTRPAEGAIQYTGEQYVNGGNYSIKLRKEGSGIVWVKYWRATGHETIENRVHYNYAEDNWVWQEEEEGVREEEGKDIYMVMYWPKYPGDYKGAHTWFTAVGWSAMAGVTGSNRAVDNNNFNVENKN